MNIAHVRTEGLHHICTLVERALEILLEWSNVGLKPAEFWGNAPHPTLTGIGVTWLYGFQFEIKVIAKLPQASEA